MIINIGIKGAKGAVRGIGKVSGALASAGKMAGVSALKFAKFGAVAGVAFGGAALRESSRFADNLREIGTLGSEVSEDMARLSKELRLTAGEFGQPIGAVAKAQYDIISAGFNEVAVSSEILRASSQLAVAGVTDVGTTADVITSSMNAYALSTEHVGMVSANLFQTVKSGKTTMTELGASLGQVIPFSASAGMSLEQVGVAMASITAKGVSTAEASTALKGAIVGLTNATPASIKAMEELGIEVAKTSDGGLDFTQTLENIAKVQEQNPDAINKIMPNIRGQLALKAITSDMEGFRGVVQDFASKDPKLVQDAVDQMNMSFGQQSRMLRENLRSAMIEIGTTIGSKLLPQMADLNVALQNIGNVGFDVIGKRIIDNMGAIMVALRETMIVMFGRAVRVIPELLFNALKKAIDMAKSASMIIWEPLVKFLKIAWLNIKQVFVDGINGVIFLINDMINLMNKLPGVNMETVGLISTTYQEQIDSIMSQTTRFEELFGAGLSSSEESSEKIKSIWAGLKSEIFAMNQEQIKSSNDANQAELDNQQTRVQGLEVVKQKIDEVKNAEVESYQTTLSGLRNQIKGFLAQAIAKVIAAEAGKGIFGVATATAGAIAFTSLFDKMVPKFAKGGEMITSGPQLFMAGDNPGGRERITVEPLTSMNSGGGGKSVVVNINAPLVDETVRDSILPSIQKAMNLELA